MLKYRRTIIIVIASIYSTLEGVITGMEYSKGEPTHLPILLSTVMLGVVFAMTFSLEMDAADDS